MVLSTRRVPTSVPGTPSLRQGPPLRRTLVHHPLFSLRDGVSIPRQSPVCRITGLQESRPSSWPSSSRSWTVATSLYPDKYSYHSVDRPLVRPTCPPHRHRDPGGTNREGRGSDETDGQDQREPLCEQHTPSLLRGVPAQEESLVSEPAVTVATTLSVRLLRSGSVVPRAPVRCFRAVPSGPRVTRGKGMTRTVWTPP